MSSLCLGTVASPRFGLVTKPPLGLLALAVAFVGGVCSVLLPGGFPKRLCQLTPTGVPTALHSCQHCLTFSHCQSGGCEMVLWF